MESEESKNKPRFVKVAGLEQVYEPGGSPGHSVKKHPCPDCHFCQQCSDSRCYSCRSGKNRGRRETAVPCRKLSLREQILLYERINVQAGKVEDVTEIKKER